MNKLAIIVLVFLASCNTGPSRMAEITDSVKHHKPDTAKIGLIYRSGEVGISGGAALRIIVDTEGIRNHHVVRVDDTVYYLYYVDTIRNQAGKPIPDTLTNPQTKQKTLRWTRVFLNPNPYKPGPYCQETLIRF